MPTEEQGSTEITHASRKVILAAAILQLPGETAESSNEEMEQDAPATVKRKRPTEDAAAGSLQAVWSTRDPTEEDKGPWERATTRARRKAQLKESGAPQPTTIKRERETIGTHVIRLQPTERCDMTKLQDFPLNIIQAPVNIIQAPVNIIQVPTNIIQVPTNIIQALTNIIRESLSTERTPVHCNLGGNQYQPGKEYFHPGWVN